MKKLALSPIRLGFVGFSLLAWALLSFPSSSSVQQWAKAYGGKEGFFKAESIQQTRDGGYIVAGWTAGAFGVIGFDAWVLKLDANGNVQWEKMYGGSEGDFVFSIQQTQDGGYIVAGKTESFGAGNGDVWVLKLDAKGNVQWQKTYGGSEEDAAFSIQQTQDGGYIVAGRTYSFSVGESDIWVLKLDANGNVVWQKTYGGSEWDEAYSIQQTSDGGYIVAGKTFFKNSDNIWVLKLGENGNVVWQKRYGGTYIDLAYSIQQTSDGGYIVAGYTDSFGAGNGDFWVLKLDASGNVVWQKTYGGGGIDEAKSIQQTRDGGYIVAGKTYSFGAGWEDAWVLKLDANGNVQWQKTYGGSRRDEAHSIQQTKDGGYIIAGETSSFGAGGSNFLVLKLDANGNIAGCPIVGTSSATVSNTSVVGVDTNAYIRNSPAIANNTNTTVKTTTANITQTCTKR